jgi:predicted nucleic acid-binding protein
VLDDYDNLETAIIAFLEFLLISDRFSFDRTRAVANLLDLVPLKPENDVQLVLKAATYQDEDGVTAFDAFHAATAEHRGGRICSSDGVYDKLELDRVPLEDLPE